MRKITLYRCSRRKQYTLRFWNHMIAFLSHINVDVYNKSNMGKFHLKTPVFKISLKICSEHVHAGRIISNRVHSYIQVLGHLTDIF